MEHGVGLRSFTDARLAVIPAAERDARYASAKQAGSRRPLLRSVGPADAQCGQIGGLDLAVGLYARIGSDSEEEELAGLIAVREVMAWNDRSWRAGDVGALPPERLLVLESLTLREEMRRWQPSVRVLLAATAAVLVATVAHDPSFRTYVACRTPIGDDLAGDAIVAIGGRSLEPAGMVPVPSRGAGGHALCFLDEAAAARSAAIVLDHMAGAAPTHPLAAGGPARRCTAVLSITFPRVIRTLAEELVEIRAGRVELGWRAPVVVGNDVALPRQERTGAATI